MLSALSQFVFGNSGLFGGQHGGFSGASSHKDKSLSFDSRSTDIEQNRGEQLIASFFPIEDVKGNPDELGVLQVTNLRLIWICCKKKRVNLSIGWRTVSMTFEQNIKDSLSSSKTSLCVLTKYESIKYEFVFNKMQSFGDIWSEQEDFGALEHLRTLVNGDKSSKISHLSPMYVDNPFMVVFRVWQSYKRTQLFRHCRANLTNLLITERGPSIGFREINKLPGEDVLDIYTNIVQSESRAIKYTGILILTNVRVIWIDESLPLRNLSIPYIRIEGMKLKRSDKIIINTHDYLATSNQIELRLQKELGGQTEGSIKEVFDQMQNLHTIFKSKPRFGPESCPENIEFIERLKPIEHYLDVTNGVTTKVPDNLGPALTSGRNAIMGDFVDKSNEKRDSKNNMSRSMMEDEDNLAEYKLKLSNYLNERPVYNDKELIYSHELGLVVEMPAKNMDLKHIWHIEM